MIARDRVIVPPAAARGQLPAEEVAVALKLVLSMEGTPYQ
jgi:hypothetical protein